MEGAGAGCGRILIVEDDAGIALLERKTLERAGYRTAMARTPDEALALAGDGAFDLAVLNYRLAAAETGLDLYHRLQHGHPDLPAILVTGFSDEGKVIEALRAGIRDVVPKAGDYLDYLPQAVARVLKGVRAEQQLAASEARLREINEELERRVAERTEELRQTKEDAEEANRAKDRFLAVLSHELRTPLTPVLTTVQVLERRADLPAEVADAFAMIRRNIELETRLIDDLLDLTRIARGKLELSVRPVNVHEALQEVLEICGRDLEAKRIAVLSDFAARQTVIEADPARLQQIFWNVVKNAGKFTPDGGRIEVRTRDGAAGTIEVEVADSGVGIDPHLLPRIFDAFEQGGPAVTRLFGGLGLGLAISKVLVDLHGGSISARSDGAGRGATFTIILGAARGAVPLPPAAEAPAGGEPAELRILLVEDHPDTRAALGELLSLRGHQVRTADSMTAALGILENGLENGLENDRFDLIISDLGLPDGSGLDLMREVRSRISSDLRGICLTGFGMEEDVQRSREAGFLAHLIKPVSVQALEAVLHRVMQI